MIKDKKPLTMLFSFLICLMLFSVTSSYASLMITPLRASFEGRDRSKVITLINNSNEKRTYRMSWRLLSMTESARYEPIESDDNSDHAKKARMFGKMVRFTPRQVTIEPGGRQRIRLSLRKPAELLDGEYRAHLSFYQLPKTPSPSDGKTENASLVLHLKLGFSIPIIVRQGDLDVTSKIQNVSIIPAAEDAQKKLSLMVDISRSGNKSTFGRIRIYGLANGKEKQIGILNNVAIFTEINQKHIRVPLQVDHINYPSIRVVYEGDSEFRGVIFDEKIINISG